MSACAPVHEVRRARPLLGTLIEIRAEGSEPALAAAVNQAFAEIEICERLLSAHREDSDVARIRAAAAGTELTVDARTWEVISLAHSLSAASNGAFDITIAPQLAQLGYLPAMQEAERSGTWRDLEPLSGNRLRLHARVAIDLGGIGKGYAVDRAVEVLQQAGVDAGCVNAGGDLRVFGERAERIHVRDPSEPTRLLPLGELRDGACATSAPYFAKRLQDGAPVTPLIDTKERRPLSDFASVTVTSPTCAVSDALTKIVILLGADAAPLLRTYGANAFQIKAQGELHSCVDAASTE